MQLAVSRVIFSAPRSHRPVYHWLCGTETNPGPSGTQMCPQDQDGNGTITGTITAENVVAASMTSQQLAARELDAVIPAIRAGVACAKVHTNLSPAGEIRGQLKTFRHEGRSDDD